MTRKTVGDSSHWPLANMYTSRMWPGLAIWDQHACRLPEDRGSEDRLAVEQLSPRGRWRNQ